LATANKRKLSKRYRAGTVTQGFLQQVAKLSWSEDGPKLARQFLAKHGIHLVVARHLPNTYLDGAALKLVDGTPVIGLTLRYDRIDNFWFCLLHELAHVGRHMDRNGDAVFVDDLTLRDVRDRKADLKEHQADEWAEEALIPKDVWEASALWVNPSPMAVVNLAKALQIHPATVAGRIRHATKNYRLLSHFVGTGEVRRHFESETG
jgi:HTH-type transcriptional regulator / antitoxin HigA